MYEARNGSGRYALEVQGIEWEAVRNVRRPVKLRDNFLDGVCELRHRELAISGVAFQPQSPHKQDFDTSPPPTLYTLASNTNSYSLSITRLTMMPSS
jgi:hypothetical protein